MNEVEIDKLCKKAVSIIESGGVIIAPADTVYGIFGSANHLSALERVYSIKGRKREKPFGIFTSKEKINSFTELTPIANKLIYTFWPAPISLIAKKKSTFPEHFSPDEETVLAICPKNPVLSKIVKNTDHLIFSTTCNFSGEKEIVDIEELVPFRNLVDFVLENHFFAFAKSVTTIVNTTLDKPVIVRQGAVSEESIKSVFPEIRSNSSLLIQ